MWSNDDDLSQLDTNEGYASRLIGSPDSVIEQVEAFRDVGVDMLHLALDDTLFEEAVLPAVIQM
jgi:alkanesulfonate monooxygenase SsuD/methylene tetrahydromethanopterin reductase-like flavin-dependent oxidoreductase (luciferase family)